MSWIWCPPEKKRELHLRKSISFRTTPYSLVIRAKAASKAPFPSLLHGSLLHLRRLPLWNRYLVSKCHWEWQQVLRLRWCSQVAQQPTVSNKSMNSPIRSFPDLETILINISSSCRVRFNIWVRSWSPCSKKLSRLNAILILLGVLMAATLAKWKDL